MKQKYLNIVFAVLIIVLACIFFKYADTFNILPGQADIGPKAFPRGVCIGLIILSALLIISEVRKNSDEKIMLFNRKFFIGVATAILFLLLYKTIGFVLLAIISIFIMEILMLNEPLKKAWPLVVSSSIIVPIALQLIFGTLLKVPLPKGILSFLF